MTCFRLPRLGAAALSAVLLLSPVWAAEPAPELAASALLGADVKGANWDVAPAVKGDGLLREFAVTSPYGDFAVHGLLRMNDRLQELRALQVLEKMSEADVFLAAVTNAGLAPIRFGRDLLLDPIETAGNLVSGVGDMVESVSAGISGETSGRDALFDSAVGITKAMRDLARELKVDPYTDFTPLREGLEEIARVMAAGDISVSAALSVIPGGAGIAVSATSTASGVASTVYDNTSDEIDAIVAGKLEALGVEEAIAKAFIANHLYSPADEVAIADALTALNARNSSAFVLRAAAAASVDGAKFNRYRAELLARESARLGTLVEFVAIADVALNRDAEGRLIAAFPFDGVAWTEAAEAALAPLSDGAAALGDGKPHVFATRGGISPMAGSELKSRGWTVLALD